MPLARRLYIAIIRYLQCSRARVGKSREPAVVRAILWILKVARRGMRKKKIMHKSEERLRERK